MKLWPLLPTLFVIAACETVPSSVPIADPVVDEPVIEAPVIETEPAEEVQIIEAEPAEEEPIEDEVIQPVPQAAFLDISGSPLVQSLVSESIAGDDVAIMGVVSGARAYCELDWQPGFVSLINIANRQGLDVGDVADEHGYYLGATRRALAVSEYTCIDEDRVQLRAINPY